MRSIVNSSAILNDFRATESKAYLRGPVEGASMLQNVLEQVATIPRGVIKRHAKDSATLFSYISEA